MFTILSPRDNRTRNWINQYTVVIRVLSIRFLIKLNCVFSTKSTGKINGHVYRKNIVFFSQFIRFFRHYSFSLIIWEFSNFSIYYWSYKDGFRRNNLSKNISFRPNDTSYHGVSRIFFTRVVRSGLILIRFILFILYQSTNEIPRIPKVSFNFLNSDADFIPCALCLVSACPPNFIIRRFLCKYW